MFLAYFSHNSFIIYFGFQLLILFWNKNLFKKQYLRFYAVVIGMVGAYWLLSFINSGGQGLGLQMLAYPFAVNGDLELMLGTKTFEQVFQEFLATPWFNIVWIRVVSGAFLFLPLWFLLAIIRLFIPDPIPPFTTPPMTLLLDYRMNLCGVIGIVAFIVLIPLIWSWLKHKYTFPKEFWISILTPMIFFTLYIGRPNWSTADMGAQGSFPFLIIIIASYVLSRNWKRRWKVLPIVGIVGEFGFAVVLSLQYLIQMPEVDGLMLVSVNILNQDIIWMIIWFIIGWGLPVLIIVKFFKKGDLLNVWKQLDQPIPVTNSLKSTGVEIQP